MNTTPAGDATTILLVDDQASDGALDGIPPSAAYQTLTSQALRERTSPIAPNVKVAVTTVVLIHDVLARLDAHDTRRAAIETLRDKYAFRQLLSAHYPDFHFQRIQLHAIPALVLAPEARYVVKPVRGAFATAVRTISATSNLPQLVTNLQHELERNSTIFSAAALSQEDFLLESFIDGEEYAVDMFYDGRGQPVIMNIYYHPMPRNPAYLHMLYYTTRGLRACVPARAHLF